MKLLCFLLASAFFQEALPFKPKEEFDIKLDFKFKPRPNDLSRVDLNETRKEYEKRVHGGPLPYLYVDLNVLRVHPDEYRIRVVNNRDENVLTKKLEKGTALKLDLGFTDDIKDRISAHEYTAYFISEDKKMLSRIVISFGEDGTYLVNGEKRGKL